MVNQNDAKEPVADFEPRKRKKKKRFPNLRYRRRVDLIGNDAQKFVIIRSTRRESSTDRHEKRSVSDLDFRFENPDSLVVLVINVCIAFSRSSYDHGFRRRRARSRPRRDDSLLSTVVLLVVVDDEATPPARRKASSILRRNANTSTPASIEESPPGQNHKSQVEADAQFDERFRAELHDLCVVLVDKLPQNVSRLLVQAVHRGRTEKLLPPRRVGARRGLGVLGLGVVKRLRPRLGESVDRCVLLESGRSCALRRGLQDPRVH